MAETKDFKDIITNASSLSADEQEALTAAIKDVINSRRPKKRGGGGGGGGGGGDMPPEVEIKIDPRLKKPKDKNIEDDDDDDEDDIEDDIDIEDPDHLLKPEKDKSKSKSKDKDKDKDKEKTDDEDGDGEKEDDTDDKKDDKDKKAGEKDGEDDDEDGEGWDEKEAGEKDHSEEGKIHSFEKPENVVSRTKKLAEKAKDRAEKLGKGDLVDRINKAVSKLDEAIEKAGGADNVDKDLLSDLISEVLDAVVESGAGVKSTDQEIRVKKIKDAMSDPEIRAEMQAEDEENYERDPVVMAQRKAEADKLAARAEKAARSLEAFKIDFENAITEKVKGRSEYEDDTYAAINRRWAGTPVVRPGTRIEDKFDDDKPVIGVYIDQSGSWDDTDVERALDAISVVAQYAKDGEIEMHVMYFSNVLSQDQEYARRNGSTECWDWCLDDMEKYHINNVVFVTDSDINTDWGMTGRHGCIRGRSLKIPGYVWWIWKDSFDTRYAVRKLVGAEGYSEYELY